MMLKPRRGLHGYRRIMKTNQPMARPVPHRWRVLAAAAVYLLAAVGGSAIPADAALSYVGLGDSIAAGFGVSPGQGYVEVYGAELAVDLGVPVNVTNLGVPGTTSTNLLNSLTSNAAVRTAVAGADIITYDIGGNDLLMTIGQCAANDAVCMQAFLSSVASNLTAILTEIRSLNPGAVVLTMDYQCISNPGIDCVVGSTDGYSPFFFGLNDTIHSVADAGTVPVAAVFTAFDGPGGTNNPFASGYLGPDGIHPNSTGYAVIAAAFHAIGPTRCGDGVVQSDEACDDQNRVPGDGCSATCTVEPGWVCSGQPSVCTPACGDGQLQSGEGCDDQNHVPGDGCSATCTVEPGWTCSGQPSVCTPFCGDGKIIANEECDAGAVNGEFGSCCTPNCTITTTLTCLNASASNTVGPSGATVTSPDGTLALTIPPGTLSEPTRVGIAGGRAMSKFGIGTTAQNLVLLGDFAPNGLIFSPPVTVMLTWQADAQGIVSGTHIREKNLKIFQDGVPVPGTTTCGLQVCGVSACCNQVPPNAWTVQASSFGELAVGTDPCVPAMGSKLIVTKVTSLAGDSGLNFTGAFTLTPPVAPTLDPVTKGFEVRLVDLGTAVLDIELPAGAFDPAAGTGWIVNRTQTKWRFVTTTQAATGGVFKAVLTDKGPRHPGLVTFLVKGKGGNYAVGTAVEADVVLPDSGQCFAATWPQSPPATPGCALKHSKLKCK
jgi:cysteine-rich repeat protein